MPFLAISPVTKTRPTVSKCEAGSQNHKIAYQSDQMIRCGMPTRRRFTEPTPVRLCRFLYRFCAVVAALTLTCPNLASGQEAAAIDESYFVRQLFPLLHSAQCVRCHSDNGVASETSLEFPRADASEGQIALFGLSLLDFVDSKTPADSLLIQKPTRRVKHTGGQRIQPGSAEEKALQTWVNYLAGLSSDQVRAARQRIAAAEKRSTRTPTVRRLTHSQYDHAVRDLLGDQIQPASSFPKEDFISGFKNQVEGQGVSPLQAEAYGKAAERLAAAAFRFALDDAGARPRVALGWSSDRASMTIPRIERPRGIS